MQVLEPGDLLHLHGKDPLNPDKETYIITGDSGQGMTGGTIGGIVVADLLLGMDEQNCRGGAVVGEAACEQCYCRSMFRSLVA